MSLSGSGIGAQFGNLQQPSFEELQQTAATANFKTSVGLTKDTLSIPFYEIGGQIGRYPANASGPTLPPQTSTRGTKGMDNENGAGWKQSLNTLLEQLPEAVRNDYLVQMSLSLDQRNPNFVALDNVLSYAAACLAWIGKANGPTSTEGVAAQDRLYNEALPYLAMNNLSKTAAATLSQSTNFLDAVGANYPQYDALRDHVRQATNGLNEMRALKEQSTTLTDTPLQKQDYAKLSLSLSKALQQYNSVNPHSDLSIVGYTMQAMATLTAALSLDSQLSPSLFLALSLFSVGLATEDSSAGIASPALLTLSHSLTNGLSALFLSGSSPTTQQLMENYINANIIGSVVLGTIISNSGLGYIPHEDPVEEQITKQYTTQLAITLAVHAGAIRAVTNSMVETLKLAQRQELYLQTAFYMLAINTLVFASTPLQNTQEASTLFDSLNGTIAPQIDLLDSLVSNSLTDDTVNNSAVTAISIALSQAKAALMSHDSEAYQTAIFASLSALDLSTDQIKSALAQLQNNALMISQNLTGNLKDQLNYDTQINLIG